LKYEEVFIKAYGSVAEARRGIGAWFAFYNNERPHQALDYLTPSQVFEQAGTYGHVDNARGVDHLPTVVQQQQAVSIQ
jgi:putative transposase